MKNIPSLVSIWQTFISHTERLEVTTTYKALFLFSDIFDGYEPILIIINVSYKFKKFTILFLRSLSNII